MTRNRILLIIFIIIIIALLAYVPLFVEKDSTINLIILIFLYIILASSWNMVFSSTLSIAF